MPEFKFNIGDYVAIAMTKEMGEVIGRYDSATSECSYMVRYASASGTLVEMWLTESALVRAVTKASPHADTGNKADTPAGAKPDCCAVMPNAKVQLAQTEAFHKVAAALEPLGLFIRSIRFEDAAGTVSGVCAEAFDPIPF